MQKKKNIKKHISKYMLTKHSNKKLLIYILCSLCFFMKIYTQTYEENSTQADMCLKRLKSRLFICGLFKST